MDAIELLREHKLESEDLKESTSSVAVQILEYIQILRASLSSSFK